MRVLPEEAMELTPRLCVCVCVCVCCAMCVCTNIVVSGFRWASHTGRPHRTTSQPCPPTQAHPGCEHGVPGPKFLRPQGRPALFSKARPPPPRGLCGAMHRRLAPSRRRAPMQAPPNPFSTCRSRDDEEHGRQPCEPVERVAHDGPAVGAPRLRGGQPVAVHREPGAVPSKRILRRHEIRTYTVRQRDACRRSGV